jgi:hypothetical protein
VAEVVSESAAEVVSEYPAEVISESVAEARRNPHAAADHTMCAFAARFMMGESAIISSSLFA